MNKELLKGLSPEQVAKIRRCKSAQDFLDLAKEEGVALNDEQLAAISGGACSSSDDDKKDKHRKIES